MPPLDMSTIVGLATLAALCITALRYLIRLGVLIDAIEQRVKGHGRKIDDHERRISTVEGALGAEGRGGRR